MSEKRYKPIQVRVPVGVWNLLEAEAAELSESLGGYALKAICERYNRDTMTGRMDRMPTGSDCALYNDAAEFAKWKQERKKQ